MAAAAASSASAAAAAAAKRQRPADGWACGVCTLRNVSEHLACLACGSERGGGGEAAARPAKRRRRAKAEASDGSGGDDTEPEDGGGEAALAGDDAARAAADALPATARATFVRALSAARRAVDGMSAAQLHAGGAHQDVMERVSTLFDSACAAGAPLRPADRADAFGLLWQLADARFNHRRSTARVRRAPSVVALARGGKGGGGAAAAAGQPLAGTSVNDVRAARLMDDALDALYRRVRNLEFDSLDAVRVELVMLESRFFSDMSAVTVAGEPSVEQRAAYFRGNQVRRFLEYAEERLASLPKLKARKDFLPGWFETGDSVDDDEPLRVPLPEDGTEHAFVMGLFQQGGFRVRRVRSVERVQNLPARERYLTQRATMQDRTEAFLFHGSSNKSIELIADSNLDPRLSGKANGVAYGRGAYLARHAQTSLGYCRPQRGQTCKMLLVKTLLGRWQAIGKPSMVKPPDGFDSVTDQTRNPGIHVVFDMAQLYPAYVITFDP